MEKYKLTIDVERKRIWYYNLFCDYDTFFYNIPRKKFFSVMNNPYYIRLNKNNLQIKIGREIVKKN